MGEKTISLGFFAAAIFTCAFCGSCSEEAMAGAEPVSTAPVIAEPLSGEAAAIATFNDFMDSFLEAESQNGATRSSTTNRPKVSRVHSTNSVAYGEPFSMTRSSDDGIPMYELTLENDDSTEGFAVVAGEEEMQNVMAYVPDGAVSDTTYNEGLAMWFRDMYAMGRNVQSAQTRAEEWQRYWDTSPLYEISNHIQVRAFTEAERSSGSWKNYLGYGPIDYALQKGPLITSSWNQTAPYNNRVPKYYTQNGVTQRCRVGCFAVAIGQIMNYHNHPAQYNWSSLKFTQPVSSTQISEVSRLLMDIATVGGTIFRDSGAGATGHGEEVRTLNHFGYNITYNYVDTGKTGNLIIPEIDASRPVAVSGTAYDENGRHGHIWVVDGTYVFERWYYTWSTTDQLSKPPTHLVRIRHQGRLFHCNWGWGGLSNGWYYQFRPKQAPSYTDTGEYHYNFRYDKTVYTGISPK